VGFGFTFGLGCVSAPPCFRAGLAFGFAALLLFGLARAFAADALDTPFEGAFEPEERRRGALVTLASPLPAASAAAASSATLVAAGGLVLDGAGRRGGTVPVSVLGLDHQRDCAHAVALLQVHHSHALGRATHS
jgi:hypothetical protein